MNFTCFASSFRATLKFTVSPGASSFCMIVKSEPSMIAFLFLLNPVALIFVILTDTAFVLVSVPATIKALAVHRLLLIAETTFFGGSISIEETGAGVGAGGA